MDRAPVAPAVAAAFSMKSTVRSSMDSIRRGIFFIAVRIALFLPPFIGPSRV